MKIEKKKLINRLRLLNDGRSHYLEFLRNLGPQSFLLSLSLLFMSKLDFGKVDFDNFGPTFASFMLLGAFLLAAYANTKLFYERCFPDWGIWLKGKEDLHAAHGFKRISFLPKIAAATYRERLVEFIEFILAMFILQVTLAGVIIIAIYSASNIWQATQKVGSETAIRQTTTASKPVTLSKAGR